MGRGGCPGKGPTSVGPPSRKFRVTPRKEPLYKLVHENHDVHESEIVIPSEVEGPCVFAPRLASAAAAA